MMWMYLFTETHEQLQAQFREMQLEHYQLKEEYDDLKEKMKFFTKVLSYNGLPYRTAT
jgi:hypothetical protein